MLKKVFSILLLRVPILKNYLDFKLKNSTTCILSPRFLTFCTPSIAKPIFHLAICECLNKAVGKARRGLEQIICVLFINIQVPSSLTNSHSSGEAFETIGGERRKIFDETIESKLLPNI